MVLTFVLITVIILLIFYLIIYNQINKIRKEYIKADMTEEMREIITIFTDRANQYITLLEEMSVQIEQKKEQIETLMGNIQKNLPLENLNANKSEGQIDNIREIPGDERDFKDIDTSLEQRVFNLYERGEDLEAISKKLNKPISEIKFIYDIIKMKKRMSP